MLETECDRGLIGDRFVGLGGVSVFSCYYCAIVIVLTAFIYTCFLFCIASLLFSYLANSHKCVIKLSVSVSVSDHGISYCCNYHLDKCINICAVDKSAATSIRA